MPFFNTLILIIMSPPSFFKSQNDDNFDLQLKKAISLIYVNNSLIAKTVYKAIQQAKVNIRSFANLSQQDFLGTREDLQQEGISIPQHFPPNLETLAIIEKHYHGLYFPGNNNIYITYKTNPKLMAEAVIHEVAHYLNTTITTQEEKLKFKPARYRDEIRSFLAEEMFKNDKKPLTRGVVKKVHQIVTSEYPEYAENNSNYKTFGFVFSSYDSPKEMPENYCLPNLITKIGL